MLKFTEYAPDELKLPWFTHSFVPSLKIQLVDLHLALALLPVVVTFTTTFTLEPAVTVV
jgi:hypothetical protein